MHVWYHRLVVFFFKQKTAYEMRISDWSSDVCSSDLKARGCRSGGDHARREDQLVIDMNVADERQEERFRRDIRDELLDRAIHLVVGDTVQFGGGEFQEMAFCEPEQVVGGAGFGRYLRLDGKSIRLNSLH